jgi:hypothetical protein
LQRQLVPGGAFYECTQQNYKQCRGEFTGGTQCSITLRPISIRPCAVVTCINDIYINVSDTNSTVGTVCLAEAHGSLAMYCGPQGANIKDIR